MPRQVFVKCMTPDTNEWEALPPMHKPRRYHTAVIVGIFLKS